jgi:hypothetical protein
VSAVAEKRCTGPCGQVKDLGEFGPEAGHRDGRKSRCRACLTAAANAARAANPEALRAREQRWRDAHRKQLRAKTRARERRRYAANPEPKREVARRGQGKLRAVVLAHYGRACACCGGTKRLTIDHIEGNGTQHRAELFGRPQGVTWQFYRWLIREGFPGGYQTLCGPCNSSKGDGDRCRLGHSP